MNKIYLSKSAAALFGALLILQLQACSGGGDGGGGGEPSSPTIDGTPNSFAFTDVSSVELATLTVSNAVTISGVNTSVAIYVTGGEYSINGAAFTVVGGTATNNDTVRVRHVSSTAFLTQTDTTLTIGGVSDTFSSTTLPDTVPDSFTFVDVTGVAVSTPTTSSSVVIVGINGSASVSVVGGDYSINGGAFTNAAGTLVNGDSIRVRHTSAAGYLTSTGTTLTVDGVADTFTSTTVGPSDTTPDTYVFTDVTGVARGVTSVSNAITVSGIDAPSAITVSGGEYSINGGTFTSAAGMVASGNTVRVRHISSANYYTSTTTTLTIGGVTGVYTSTTVGDPVPDAFSFIDLVDVARGSPTVSNAIIVSGIAGPAPISIVGGDYSVNSGAYTNAASTVVNGDSIRVRHTSSSAYSTITSTTLTIGGVSDTFTSTTGAAPPDSTPDQFSFVDVSNAVRDTTYVTSAITISGINRQTPIRAIGGEYSINGGSFTVQQLQVYNGDIVRVRQVSSPNFLTRLDTTLIVGGVSDTFSVTTGTSQPQLGATVLTLQSGALVKQLKFDWLPVASATSYRLLRSLNGATFVQIGSDIPATDTSITIDVSVHLSAWANTLYRVDACGASGCVPSTPIGVAGKMLDAIGYFKASNQGGRFGDSVAISLDGNTVAVGAVSERSAATGIDGNQSDTSATDAGAVYVFVRSGGVWSQQAYIKASNTDAYDRFGVSVALSADGSTLAVGAHTESSAAAGVGGNQLDNTMPSSGAVYVFVRSGATWSQQAYVKASNPDAYDAFGMSVALSNDGSRLAVGAGSESSSATGANGNQSNNSLPRSGAVYLFRRENGSWSQNAYLKASNPHSSDYFGTSLAFNADGSVLAVGAFGESASVTGVNNTPLNYNVYMAGATYLFDRSGETWTQIAYVKASRTEEYARFGYSLDLSDDGNTLAVGAYEESGGSTGVNGDQSFNNYFQNSGAAYVFTRLNGVWSQQAYVKASNTNSNDNFGTKLALSGNGDVLAVNAIEEGSLAKGIDGDQSDNTQYASGAVYVYTRSGTVWTHKSYVKPSNTIGGEHFGSGIALDYEGTTLAVGARSERRISTGINGDQSNTWGWEVGALYLY